MKQKVLSLVTVMLCVCLMSIPASVYGENSADSVQSRLFIEMLTGKSFEVKNDAPVLRKDFVALLADVMKIHDVEIEDAVFSDVKKEGEQAGKIYAALNQGWIVENNTFRPDDGITCYEALSIYVRALGYGTEAEMAGGYPTGYYLKAADFDINDGISCHGDEVLTYNDVFLMTENFLNAEIKAKSYVGGSWKRTTETTMLYNMYKIKKLEGIVSSVDYDYNTAFENGTEILTVGINGTTYSCSAQDDDFLGYSVEAYIRTDDDTVVYIKKTNKNTDMSVLRKNIEVSGEEFKIYNEEKGKYNKIQLARAFDLYYNGKPVTDNKTSYITGKSGIIKFLDNNRDGIFDAVFAEDYKYVTVKSINFSTEEMIIDEANKNSVIDLSKVENDYTNVITSDGETLLKNVEEGEVLAVALSEDGTRIKLYLCDTRVRGYLSSYNKSTGEISLDGTSYMVSEYFADKFGDAVYPGKEYVFTISADENIVSVNISEEMSYGYLANVYEDETKEYVICKIFTEQGNFVRVKVAEKVYIDGSSKKSGINNISPISSQLIRFKYNKSGELSAIDTASTVMPEYLGEPQPENNRLTQFNASGDITGYTYRQEISAFYPAFNASSSKVFLIPQSGSDEDYGITDNSVFINDKTYDCSEIIPYDVGADGIAGAVVYKYNRDTLKLDNSSVMVFVNEEECIIDGNDDLYRKITGWGNGEFRTIYYPAEKNIESNGNALKTGDILRYKTLNGEISRVVVDFDASENVFAPTDISSDAYFNTDVKYSSFQFQVGQVYSYYNGYIYLSSTKDANGDYDFSYKNLRNFACQTENIVIVDRGRNLVIPGTSADIRSYIDSGSEASKVVLIQNYLNTKQVIIYIG